MTPAPLRTARVSGDESFGQARHYASELASRLTAQGLRVSDEPHRGNPTGAIAVAAQRVDVHPHVGRLVVLLPGVHDPGELFWHWQRPLRGPRIGARYFQPFCRAGDVVTAAKVIAAAIDADVRARARLAHASAARPNAAEEPDGEVLVYVGHRVHALVSRMLVQLKATEKDLEDPDLLADLYGIDHLATQLRRAAERLAVLGGRTARRASAPMPISTVLRQAMAEVEAFQRVRLTLPDEDLEIPGYAGPDVIHILAELVENATRFSGTTVWIETAQVSGGLGVEVRDEGGLVLSADRLAELRRILAAPFQVSVREQVRRGQVGLLVAARLAARHGVRIELNPEPSGMRALVVLPRPLLASPASAVELQQGSFRHRTHTPAGHAASSLQHPSWGAQTRDEQCMSPATPPSADPQAQLPDGRPPLPRRTRTRPVPNETQQPPPDTALASQSVQPPSAELMARFASGLRRGRAEQRHGPASNTENG